MDFLQKAAMDGAQRALQSAITEKLASFDRFAKDLKTIHEDLADGIESTAGKIEKLLQSLNETVVTLHREVIAARNASMPEIKIPAVDLSSIENKLSQMAQGMKPSPPVSLDPVLKALDKMMQHKPAVEEWEFDIERDQRYGRIKSVSAKRVA